MLCGAENIGEQLRHGVQRLFFETLRAAEQKRLAIEACAAASVKTSRTAWDGTAQITSALSANASFNVWVTANLVGQQNAGKISQVLPLFRQFAKISGAMAPQSNPLALVSEHLGQRRTPAAGTDNANLSSHGRSTLKMIVG